MATDRKPVDWTEETFAVAMRRLAKARSDESERGVVQDVLLQLSLPAIVAGYGWPPVMEVVQEYRLPRGRIDVFASHADGSVTVIECKASAAPRDILPAVGQVLDYAAQLEGYFGPAVKVRCAIASRADGVALKPLRPVYRRCGIEPMFCAFPVASQRH